MSEKISTIRFKTKLVKIRTWTILRLPESASIKLPSRGQVMVEGTINDFPIQVALEPDGKWGHWFRVDKTMRNVVAGDLVTLVIEPTKKWPEPEIPADLHDALKDDLQAYNLWTKITPMARWEWIRWIRGTNQQETRQRRIKVARSKLKTGERRPCCWNRNQCTEPYVSKGGILLDPT